MKCIIGGTVYDGSGSAPRRLDVLLDGDRIADLLPPGSPLPADCERFDATGYAVAPGFIDAHAHAEAARILYPDCRTRLLQGVTTEVSGNCGSSSCCVAGAVGEHRWQTYADYCALLNASGQAVNIVHLCGHNSIRRAVMGDANRAPTPDELARMKRLVSELLEQGCAGFSTGLTYFPGKFSDTAELLALAACLKGTGKVYATHLRSEGDRLIEAVDEALAITHAAGCTLEISHLKTIFPRNFHKIDDLLNTLEKARSEGLPVFADRYPYIYSCTSLQQVLPAPYNTNPDIRSYLRQSADHVDEVAEALKHSPRELATTILYAKPWRGKTIAEAAATSNLSCERITAELLRENPGAVCAFRCMSEDNLNRILDRPWVSVGSDGLSSQLDNPDDYTHPRAVATFPVFFRRVSARLGVAEAIRKMTSQPAQIFHIPNRGLLQKGYVADITVFAPDRFDSQADFAGYAPPPSGLKAVFVAGHTAWSNDHPDTVSRHGQILAI